MDKHIEYWFGVSQFDWHKCGFLVPVPSALIEDVERIGFAELIDLCGYDLVSTLLAFK